MSRIDKTESIYTTLFNEMISTLDLVLSEFGKVYFA